MFALNFRHFGAIVQANYLFSKIFNIIQHLLEASADPNPRGVAIIAMQTAALCNDISIVQLLLDAGAHANAVGDYSAIVAVFKRLLTEEHLLSIEWGISNWEQ